MSKLKGRPALPILTKTWTYTEHRVGIVWRLFGVRVFGVILLPWDVQPRQEWRSGNGGGFNG